MKAVKNIEQVIYKIDQKEWYLRNVKQLLIMRARDRMDFKEGYDKVIKNLVEYYKNV